MEDFEFRKPIEVRVSDLRLDRNNYRVDWKPETTEEETILKLFEEEDITGMAKDIIASEGLNPQENFIAIYGVIEILVISEILIPHKSVLRDKSPLS